MEKKDLKKILAGISIAGLLSGVVLTAPGCATKAQTSCSGVKQETMETHPDTKPDPTKTGCSGDIKGTTKTSCSG